MTTPIAAIVIHSIQRGISWSVAYISKEIFEIFPPSVTKANAPCTIILKRRCVRIFSSINNIRPQMVNRVLAFPVGTCTIAYSNASLTTATMAWVFFTSQVFVYNDTLISATALAQPATYTLTRAIGRIFKKGIHLLQHSQPIEYLTNQINSFTLIITHLFITSVNKYFGEAFGSAETFSKAVFIIA